MMLFGLVNLLRSLRETIFMMIINPLSASVDFI